MSFFDALKSKYQLHLSKDELDSEEFQKLICSNLLPADHIIKDGETISIYAEDVTISEILFFFKERMPFADIHLEDHVLNLKEKDEVISAKLMIFTSLAALLESASEIWNGASNLRGCNSLDAGDLEYKRDGRTLH